MATPKTKILSTEADRDIRRESLYLATSVLQSGKGSPTFTADQVISEAEKLARFVATGSTSSSAAKARDEPNLNGGAKKSKAR